MEVSIFDENKKICKWFVKANHKILKQNQIYSVNDLRSKWISEFGAKLDLENKQIIFKDNNCKTYFFLVFN